jgi:hypothetical protein
MEVCSLPLLQQLSLKNTRELEPACSDLSDGEEQQVLKARRYSGIYSPGKTATEPEAAAPLPRWSPADSSTLYNVPGWGDKFFKASDDGHMLVAPQGGERRGRRLPPRLPASVARAAALPAGLLAVQLRCHNPTRSTSAQRAAPRWTCMR